MICDEAFLPLVPAGEQQSMIPLVEQHPNLVVIRSLTKLFGLAGLRVGYAIAAGSVEALVGMARPWPVNGIAAATIEQLLASWRYQRWCRRVQHWTSTEGGWIKTFGRVPGLCPALQRQFRWLARDRWFHCGKPGTSDRISAGLPQFPGLGESWLRIGLDRSSRRSSALSEGLSTSV